MQNTLGGGTVRYVIFKEDDTWYGAALEFNIVESGNNPEEVIFLLNEAIAGYVETAQKIGKKAESTLNQEPDPEYEHMWQQGQHMPLPPAIFEVGTRNLVVA